MSRKKMIGKGGPPMPSIREHSRLMRTHESLVDLISGRSPMGSLMDALAPSFLGFNLSGCLEDDLIYSDDDYDDDDYLHYAAKGRLEPHPQIKQLTDEEADKITKELMGEKERQKWKSERNKRKKQRKKEKKRLEKENVLKEDLAEEEEEEEEEEEGDLDSSADQEQTQITDGHSEENKCDLQTAAEASGNNESNSTKEKDVIELKKTDKETQKGLDLNHSHESSSSVLVMNQMSTNEKNKNKSKVVEVQQLEEKRPEVTEKAEVQEEKEDEANKKKPVDPAADDLAKRSMELASMGNRLAASGQYEVAVRCFTDAIKYNPKEFKLFGNRSLCYERLQQYENALMDADLALSIEPKWIKGLFRKGKALCGLKRYYDASLIYKDVLKLESSSIEAAQELKRAQTLHLMEMGFSWAQSSDALKAHATLEEAVEALFTSDSSSSGPEGAGASWDKINQPVVQEKDINDEEEEEGEWIVQQTTRPRMQQVKDLDSLGQVRSNSQSPTPRSRSSVKPDLFSVWVGILPPAMTYVKLHELFSRTGTIYSIKMLLEQQCAFINYTRKEDCERAIQCIDGMVVEGAPLTVRYPFKGHTGLCSCSSNATDQCQRLSTQKKECFFWRTSGCTRGDCTYRHIPEHKNIDRDKFTSRLGYGSQAGDRK